MKAMILAAGFGTRLRPMTNDIPKALVQLNGIPLLSITINSLIHYGFNKIAVNGHYLAEEVRLYIEEKLSEMDSEIHFSFEKDILDTGGGIKKMVKYLGADDPILVHNVDILSSFNLAELYAFHIENSGAATLAIQTWEKRRFLVYDEKMNLCGLAGAEPQSIKIVRQPVGKIQKLGFSGIQVIDPQLFLDYPQKKFSSIDLYLSEAAKRERVIGYQYSEGYWRDLGEFEDLRHAEKDIKADKVSIK